MKTYKISYTMDFCQTVHTLTVKALDYTKAYLAAVVALPIEAAIIEASEQSILPVISYMNA